LETLNNPPNSQGHTVNKLHYFMAIMFFSTLLSCQSNNDTFPSAPVVKTITIQLEDVKPQGHYYGHILGRYESPLSFQVSGQISRRLIELGQVVTLDQSLFELDPRDLEEARRQRLAAVESADLAFSLAMSDYQRYQKLRQAHSISQSDLDQFRTAKDLAEQTLLQAKASYQQSLNALDYATLKATGNGIITSLTAETGQVVTAGQPVATLVLSKNLEVEINLPEDKIPENKTGQPALVTLWSRPGLEISGLVREIAPRAEKNSGSVPVRISLESAPGDLSLGLAANVTITSIEAHQAALIPASALFHSGNETKVWLVKDQKLVSQPVVSQGFYGNQVKITQGLGEGDLLVTAGLHKLTEGQTVRLENETDKPRATPQ
jgi:RND family efflux transporter MFP subunit